MPVAIAPSVSLYVLSVSMRDPFIRDRSPSLMLLFKGRLGICQP